MCIVRFLDERGQGSKNVEKIRVIGVRKLSDKSTDSVHVDRQTLRSNSLFTVQLGILLSPRAPPRASTVDRFLFIFVERNSPVVTCVLQPSAAA